MIQNREMTRANVLLISLITILLLWIVAFYEGISTALKVWYVSEIYNHCFLILPCVFYFIYQKKNQILSEQITPNFWLFIPLSLLFILQLFAQVGDIKILMHIASFTALPLLLWCLLGNHISRKIAMPLSLILLSIPIGDQLIPYLQELTTDIAVPMLEFTGVPIYRNGLYLDIPEGRFLVAEACSGISFLITSIAFGCIYSYVSFQSSKKRILFILVAMLVPILANAIRVYGIILTGHLSNMEYAVGADHLIYGGVFYGIVLFILILIGERFRDNQILMVQKVSTEGTYLKSTETVNIIKCLSLVTILVIAKQIWLVNVESEKIILKDWQGPKSVNSLIFTAKANNKWRPQLQNSTLTVEGEALIDGHTVDFYGAYFDEVHGELISSQHRMFDSKYWSLLSKDAIKFGKYDINKMVVISPVGEKREILYWYQLGDAVFASQTKVKLFQTYQKIIKNEATGSLIMVSLPENQSQLNELEFNKIPNINDMILKMYYGQLNRQIAR